MSLADELRKLAELRQAGSISEEEYARAKAAVLGGTPDTAAGQPPPVPPPGASPEQQARLWAMLVHFSQYAGFVVPGVGLVVPIILWQWKKNEFPQIDAHGKNVANWLISTAIYAAVFVALAFIVIGIPLLLALGILVVVCPIVGGIKANNGEVWKYPLAIPFFK